MKKIMFLLCIFTVVSIAGTYAQEWSREDSVWLINILEGREVKINEDTKKAIEEGRLAVPSWMKNADGGLNRIETINNVGAVDSLRIQRIDPYTMPPAVFALYVLYTGRVDSVEASRSLVLSQAERESLEAALPPGARGGFYATGAVGVFGGNDFNHILSMILSPSYRQKVHNRKYAVNYKYYYDEDAAARSVGFTERERSRIRKDLANLKALSVKQFNMKQHGIDD